MELTENRLDEARGGIITVNGAEQKVEKIRDLGARRRKFTRSEAGDPGPAAIHGAGW